MKSSIKRALCLLLTLCLVLTFMPMTASAALDNRVEKAIAWAIAIANDNSHGYSQAHRNGPDYDCSSFVSTAFRQGGFNVSGSNWTGSMEQAFTSVGFKAYAASSVTLQRGDILLRHDNVRQHTELYLGNNQLVGAHWDYDGRTGDSSGKEINVYYDSAPSWHTRVLRYEGNSPSIKVNEYFNCDVTIKTTKGKTVNLYKNITDSQRYYYFDQGQTAYSTKGAKVSDGSTWYQIQAYDRNGKIVTVWLNAGSSGVKIIKNNNNIEPSISFSPSNLSVDVGSSKTVSISFKGDGIQHIGGSIDGKSLCDVSWGNTDWNRGTTSLTVTGKKAGNATITVNLMDENSKTIFSKSFSVTVNDNRVSVSANPSSLTLNLANNNSGTVRVNISGPHGGIGGLGNGNAGFKAEWIDSGSGYAVAKFTATKPGTADYTFNAYDDTKTKVVASTTIRITVTAPTYTVSYNANGGSGVPSSQIKQYDKTLTLSSVKPTRAGYIFKGWAISSAASSTQYQPGSSYTSNKDLMLYAVWERNKVESSITFSTNNLTLDSGASQTVYVRFKGDGIKYLGFEPNDYENSVCRLNWSDIDWKNGTTSVTVTGKNAGTILITVHFLDKYDNSFFSESFSVTVNNASYTVSYDANGGNGAPSSQIKQYNKPLTLSSATPTRNGYNFIGWAESPSALSAQFEPGDTFTGNKDLSLYAVWQVAHQHSLTRISEKPATETSEGNIEHWYCTGCRKYYSDAKAVNEISQSQTVLTKLKHTHSLTYYPDVASTCTKGGNLAYWRCGECGKYFSDAAGSSETSEALVSLQPLGHNYVDGVCPRDGAVDPKGPGQTNEVHLPKQNSYSQGHFSDVYPNQWFTDNVASAYELGLMKGKSSRVFDPYGDVTLAETITMACRIHSIYTKGYEDIPQSNDEKWYQQYLDYAYQNNIISWTAYHNANVESNATRVQFAEIMAKSLPDEGFYAMNFVQDDAIPDVSSADASATFVYKLYRAGILSGGDVRGTFSPQSYITRAEAAAIVSRVAESNNRVSFSLS